MTITLRAATAADQPLIRKLVRAEGLNTLRVEWPNFLIAERLESGSLESGRLESGRVVGFGQLRPHKDGIQELASLVVVADERGHGVGSLLVNALIARADRPLYLMCEAKKVGYYERFGFTTLTSVPAIPRSLRPFYYLATVITGVTALFTKEPRRLAIMAHSS